VELFYTIADSACAAARKAIIAAKLKEKVNFRNLYYPEVQHDFRVRGGHRVPALWDGEKMHQGLKAVEEAVAALPRR
jgi:hypothetical protein